MRRLRHREATWAAAEPTRGKDGGCKASMRGERRTGDEARRWPGRLGLGWIGKLELVREIGKLVLRRI